MPFAYGVCLRVPFLNSMPQVVSRYRSLWKFDSLSKAGISNVNVVVCRITHCTEVEGRPHMMFPWSLGPPIVIGGNHRK